MILAVEGLDGVGKTTVSRLLAARLNAAHVALPPPELLLRTTALLRRHDSLARYLYYLSAAAATDVVAQSGVLVVADRYVASAHALHLHVAGEAAQILRDLPLPAPTLTVYLTADEQSRRARLNGRATPLDPFEKALNDSEPFRTAVARRLRSGPNTHVIDTTGHAAEDVADAAVKIWDRVVHGGRDASTEH
ncbi:AAA family ATPase [Micromonospora robiginosa]|uniref:Thymidylate kinase n=1 Tax=Micromonospora robiginosa TaxID=2749844 RepID=A0A7L6B483_9ACTN|nr:AAA family ATPase [Micromonospora ferruginea]QLQ36712.1 AAA family ATPase [Micromonospora ferruginea]